MKTANIVLVSDIDVHDDTRVALNIEDGTVMLYNGYTFAYEVPLKDLNTKEKILSWVHHLSGKTWVDRQMLRKFIDVACDNIGISPHA